MAETTPNYSNCKYTTFLQDDKEQYKGRIDLFLDKFYTDQKFLTDEGLVDVYWAIITIGGAKYEFDAGLKDDRAEFKARWIETYNKRGKKIEFKVGLKGILREKTILLTKFKKTEDLAPGSASVGGKKINRGTQFEEFFYEDALKVLNDNTKGNRFVPFIKEFNNTLQKKLSLAISDLKHTEGLTGVLDEGSKNQSRPLKLSNGGLVVTAGGATTLDMGSTLTDITFQYGEDKVPVYLSLKYGPTLTFFNSGVGGKNGPKLFDEKEIKDYNITTKGGLAFLEMFGISSKENMNKFCESFVKYPRSKAIQGYKVPVTGNRTAIQKLLQSGIGYGYWMVHNTSGTKIDAYEITKKYMTEAATITGDVVVYFGRMNGKGKGVNITCSSKHYNFIFNVRNKQGKLFPSHVMCDYKKVSTPSERPDNGNA